MKVGVVPFKDMGRRMEATDPGEGQSRDEEPDATHRTDCITEIRHADKRPTAA